MDCFGGFCLLLKDFSRTDKLINSTSGPTLTERGVRGVDVRKTYLETAFPLQLMLTNI